MEPTNCASHLNRQSLFSLCLLSMGSLSLRVSVLLQAMIGKYWVHPELSHGRRPPANPRGRLRRPHGGALTFGR